MKRIAVTMAVVAGAAAVWVPASASTSTSTSTSTAITRSSCSETHVVVGMVGARHGAGAVEVRTNSSPSRIQLLRDGAGVLAAHPSQTGAEFGAAVETGLLNTDCHADLAIGIPDLTVDGVPDAGGVQLLFGGAHGFVAGPLITRDSAAVPGDPEPFEHLGASVLWKRDQVYSSSSHPSETSSLIIGIPGATVTTTSGTVDGAGEVLELRYAAQASDHPPAMTPYVYVQGQGLDGQPVTNAHLGASLGLLDDEHGGAGDLAVGAPNETVEGKANAGFWGIVHQPDVLFDLDDGVSFSGTQAGERLGQRITGGGGPDTNADLGVPMVSAPGMTVHGHRNAGAVATYIYDARDAIPFFRFSRMLTQGSPGVPGQVATGNRFGAALATCECNDTESAIGVPGQTIQGHHGAGAVIVIDNLSTGRSAYLEISQATKHIPGNPETGDHFGQSIGYVDRGGSGVYPVYTLAVGVPGENLGKSRNTGVVESTTTRAGTHPLRAALLTSPNPMAGDEYGSSLPTSSF